MKEPDVNYLVGIPANPERLKAAGILRYVPPPGAIVVQCDRCHQPTWIGPNQRKRQLAHPEMEFVCALCIFETLKPGDECVVTNCGGQDSSFYLLDGTAFLPGPPKEN